MLALVNIRMYATGFMYLFIYLFTTLEYVHVHKCYSLLVKIVQY